MYPKGWFVDIDDERPTGDRYPYVACLQCDGAVFTLGGLWFESESDARDFIDREVIGKGWTRGEDRGSRPTD